MAGSRRFCSRPAASRRRSARSWRCAPRKSKCGRAKCTRLMGANGAGKSTLVKIITGVFPPTPARCSSKGRPAHFVRRPGAHEPASSQSIRTRRSCPTSRRAEHAPRARRRSKRSRPAMRRARRRAARSQPCRARPVDFPLLRLIDLARALASEPRRADARRDHRRAAGRSFRARVRRGAATGASAAPA